MVEQDVEQHLKVIPQEEENSIASLPTSIREDTVSFVQSQMARLQSAVELQVRAHLQSSKDPATADLKEKSYVFLKVKTSSTRV